MRSYKLRAHDRSISRNGMREFTIDAEDAADAVTIFEYRYRRRELIPNPDDMDGPMIPALSEPFDVLPAKAPDR